MLRHPYRGVPLCPSWGYPDGGRNRGADAIKAGPRLGAAGGHIAGN